MMRRASNGRARHLVPCIAALAVLAACTDGQQTSADSTSPTPAAPSPARTATIPAEFLTPSPTPPPSPSPEDVTLELYGSEIASAPWFGTVYWKCDREAGSTVTRYSTTVVNNTSPGASITASYELSSGRTASRFLNPPRHLSTPMWRATVHVWEVEWHHKPGRVVTTISIDFSSMDTCFNPPLTDITIVRS
jgi:hypothetical protein